MPTPDIRWLQRFANFRRAYQRLHQALTQNDPLTLSDLEQEGIIQRFEYTFELAWKVFKDYLTHEGIPLPEATPRKVIKECTQRGIFFAANINPDTYLQMMLERNTLSHTYDISHFKNALNNIKNNYLIQLTAQYNFFTEMENQ